MNVVHCIDYEVKGVPVFVCEFTLTLRLQSSLFGTHIELVIEGCDSFGGGYTFERTNMLRPEQELSVQVGDLNLVIVHDHHLSMFFGTESNQGEDFQILTAKCSGPDEQHFFLSKLGEELFPEKSIVGPVP